jgi:hypothetical protein
MLKVRIESFLLDAWKLRSTLVKAVLGRTNAHVVMIATGVITHFSNDCLRLSRGDTVGRRAFNRFSNVALDFEYNIT